MLLKTLDLPIRIIFWGGLISWNYPFKYQRVPVSGRFGVICLVTQLSHNIAVKVVTFTSLSPNLAVVLALLSENLGVVMTTASDKSNLQKIEGCCRLLHRDLAVSFALLSQFCKLWKAIIFLKRIIKQNRIKGELNYQRPLGKSSKNRVYQKTFFYSV